MPDTTAPAPRGPLLAVIVLCLGGLSASLTQTMMIPIQSELPTLLSTSAANAAWVITATLLAAGVAVAIAGRVADLVGTQRGLLASSLGGCLTFSVRSLVERWSLRAAV